jgi:flagellar biosynthesis/type III secretory pathway chaperone
VKTSHDPLRLRVCGQDLCETLDRLRELHEELLEVLAAKEEALVSVQLGELSSARAEEETLLHRVVEEEKQRLLLTEEIGDLIDHADPPAVRVQEMLGHLPADLAERLAESRDLLRDAAARLGRQNRTNRALIEHSLGHIQVFLSRLVNEEMLGAGYGADGHGTAGDGGSMLLDRTG